MDVATYYFNNGKFSYAQKWFSKVDETSLAISEPQDYNFMNGYVSFVTKKYKNAKKYLKRVESSEKYGEQAKYYIGFMAYQGDDYDEATEYFDQVGDQKKYQEKLAYFQADLNFKTGNFEKAIEMGEKRLPDSDRKEASQLNKIIGESYFNLKKYDQAIPYLTAYTGKKGKWNNTDYYQLGYAYYKQDDFENAISEFNKIIGGDDAVAQNAYYHLGESYINLEKKQEALNAFRYASQMSYDKKIQEDAWLNYAKISYDIGNPYQSVPQVLTAYLDKYPETAYREEVESLLIDSYITSKNYEEALKLLENRNSFDSKVALQKVAFYRGLELYDLAKYQEAQALFNRSLSEPHEALYTARATFWKAETDYNLTNYDDALIGFKQFAGATNVSEAPEAVNLNYNIAYAYFKQKNYAEARTYFQQHITSNQEDNVRLNDAYLRLGDAFFVSSDYTNAINAYTKAIEINKIESDYAAFQKAMSHGYAGNTATKITALEDFVSTYESSGLRDDALYELGNTYVKQNETAKAMQRYDRLGAEYKMSTLLPKALLRQGLVYYNSEENEQALTKFKTITRDFPGSPESVQAVATARLIYIDLGRVDEYAAWVRTLEYVEVTDADLDNATYASAEKQYLENNTDEAIRLFNSYLNEFSNGIHALQSHFYIAQLYYKKALKDTAKPHYKFVVDAPQSEFTEVALSRLSEIYLDANAWQQAIPVLKRLENEANFPQNKTYAQSNLMKAYYQLGDYEKASTYAETILAKTGLDNKIKSDAHIIIARAAIKSGDEDKARTAYQQVELIATGEVAAEALYYNAYFKNKDNDFEASNAKVQELARDYSAYKYYAAKGLVIMANNYEALGDAFQATYILESVITNFAEFEDVVREAQQELNRLKREQAKTNSSVETEDGN
jgi:tetratricopeptide (TPR) repeat protein